MEQVVHFLNRVGEKIAGTLHLPDRPTDWGVILGHCFTCSRHTGILREICRELVGEGIAGLRFDFSGNGQSEGDFADSSYTKHIGEMKLAAAFLKEKGISRFGAGGHSMGAAISVLAASDMKNMAGVCALAGRIGGADASLLFSPDQMRELEQTGRVCFISRGRNLELTRHFFLDMRQYDLLQTIQGMKPRLMVVHGDQDEIIPVENAYEARQARPGTELMIIPGADHMFSSPDHRARIARAVAKWFAGVFRSDSEVK
jgi:putative redox protein